MWSRSAWKKEAETRPWTSGLCVLPRMLAKYKITPQALNFAAAFFTHPMLDTSFLCYYYFKFQQNGSTFARCPPLSLSVFWLWINRVFIHHCVRLHRCGKGCGEPRGTGQEVFAKACGFLLPFFLFQLALVGGLWGVLEERESFPKPLLLLLARRESKNL